jgi:calcium/calmodulin-dependent protein kinase (CaM kinase) II
VAPEVLKNIPYDQSVDMWSVGVIIYVLLCGYPPFANDNQSQLFQSIRMAEWKFVDKDWSGISEDAKDLITKLLNVDPARRLTAKEALGCKWLMQDDATLSANDLSHSADLMKKGKRSLKSVACMVMWMARGESSKGVTAVEEVLERPESKDESQGNVEEVMASPEK